MNLVKLDNLCQALHVLGDWSCQIGELSMQPERLMLEVFWKNIPFIAVYDDRDDIVGYSIHGNREAHRLFRAFLEGMEEGGAFGVVHDFFSYWRREQRRDFVAKCKDALTLMCLRLYAHGRNKALCKMLDARLKELEKELD